MKIEFELDGNQRVKIMSVDGDKRKEIGQIFTPSGSGQDVKNAIQICGFEEAFDFWGCGIYGETVIEKVSLTKEQRKMYEQWTKEGDYRAEVILNKGYFETPHTIMKKDIQLLFKDYDMETKRHLLHEGFKSCWGCYNNPCTCESKTRDKSPYNVKKSIGNKELVKQLETNCHYGIDKDGKEITIKDTKSGKEIIKLKQEKQEKKKEAKR
jgi:hypothetical protein